MNKSCLTKTAFAFNLAVGIGVALLSGCRNPRILSDRGLIPRAYAKPTEVAPAATTPAVPSTEPALPAAFSDFSPSTPVAIENPVSFTDLGEKAAEKTDKPAEKKSAATGIKLPEVPKTTLLTHTVGKNEYLSSIAVNYGVSWKSLAAFNKIDNPDKIKEGMVLTIPPGGYPVPAEKRISRKTTSKTKKAGTTAPKLTGKAGIHVVKQGEYLGKIAQMYGMKTADLKKLNGFTAKNPVLMIGQEIKVIGEAKAVKTKPAGKKIITEKPAEKTETKVDDKTAKTVEVNEEKPAASATEGTENKADGEVGGTETAPAEATVTPSADKAISSLKKLPHVVCEGETLEKLAEMYVTKKEYILQANPKIKTNADLKVGEQIIILY